MTRTRFDRCTCCGGGFDGNGDCPLYCEGRVVDGRCELHKVAAVSGLYDPVEGEVGSDHGRDETMKPLQESIAELIGPERLAELRATREAAFDRAKKLHPSGRNQIRGKGLDGLIADVRQFDEPQRQQVRDLFREEYLKVWEPKETGETDD